MKIGSTEFNVGQRTFIMGILNVTPDSFSDGGRFSAPEAALIRAEQMILQGADIIDVGGQSTRPGFEQVSEKEELNRVLPIVKALTAPVSIDTYRASVAEVALEHGASLVNDVWGFKKDREIAAVTAKFGAACCLTHNKENNNYNDLMTDILKDLEQSVNIALKSGVDAAKIILDPGIGFAKDAEQNLTVLRNLEMLTKLGFPVMLSASRKSVIGYVLGTDVNNRLEGTLALTAIGIQKGCDFVRVHDIVENKRVCLMADRLVRSNK